MPMNQIAYFHRLGKERDPAEFNRRYWEYGKGQPLDESAAKMIYAPIIEKVGSIFPDKDALIGEIGCGTGDILVCLRNMGYTNLIGLEKEEMPLRIARERGLDVHQMGHYDVRIAASAIKGNFSGLIANRVFETPVMNRDYAETMAKTAIKSLVPGGFAIIGSTEKGRMHLYGFMKNGGVKLHSEADFPSEPYVRSLVVYERYKL